MNFFLKEYKWIVAVLIAVPSCIVAYQNIHFRADKSESFYYVPNFPNSISDKKIGNADCWIGSISVNRSDAFRCSSDDDYIYDPCFENESDDIIVCPSSPNEQNPTYFKAIKKENKNKPGENPDYKTPWYIRMSDGSECRIHTGMLEFVADKSLSYYCAYGDTSSLILPVKNQNGSLSIDCVIDNHISENCPIQAAWY